MSDTAVRGETVLPGVETTDLTRVMERAHDLLDRHATLALPSSRSAVILDAGLRAHLGGGKRVRPALFLAAYVALADASAEPPATRPRDSDVDTVAACVELLHYAFLLHDDVIDDDHVRRGADNLLGAVARLARDGGATPEEAHHLGASAGLLAGDLVLATVHQAIARLEVTTGRRLSLLDLVERTVRLSVAGQLEDVAFGDLGVDPGLEGVLGMATRKTAVYSFELPLRAAAALTDAGDAVHERIAGISALLGLVFQIQDDLLVTLGDPREHGKSVLSDLRGNKQTALVVLARRTRQWGQISEHLGRPDIGLDDARRVRALLEECGAVAGTRALLAERREELDALLDAPDSPFPETLTAVIREVTARLDGRRA